MPRGFDSAIDHLLSLLLPACGAPRAASPPLLAPMSRPSNSTLRRPRHSAPPAVVNRLCRPKGAVPRGARLTKSLPPIQTSSVKSAAIHPNSAGGRWRDACAQVRAILRVAEPMTKKWHGWSTRLCFEGVRVARPVLPSNVLRASSYERFVGSVAPCESPPKPSRCIAIPRTRHSAPETYHISDEASYLPPVNTWALWHNTRQPQRARPRPQLCGTIWHEAAAHAAPLASRSARESYVLCAR